MSFNVKRDFVLKFSIWILNLIATVLSSLFATRQTIYVINYIRLAASRTEISEVKYEKIIKAIYCPMGIESWLAKSGRGGRDRQS
jgi:hypothetical protein